MHHAEAIRRHRAPYGPFGFRGLFTSPYASSCAAFAALGGMIFGYDQVRPPSAKLGLQDLLGCGYLTE